MGKKNRRYYKRILMFMMIFIILVVIPFTILLYGRAQKSITANINQSNEAVLNQIKYNYSYSSETMASLCLSAFLRYDVKKLMYNEQIEFNDQYMIIRNLSSNIMQSQPSIQSIVVYNGENRDLYSTDYRTGEYIKEDLDRFH